MNDTPYHLADLIIAAILVVTITALILEVL
jgi:hypothetical protein